MRASGKRLFDEVQDIFADQLSDDRVRRAPDLT